MHRLITRSDTSIPAICYAYRLWCPLSCYKWVWLNWYLSTQGWRCNILLSLQMLPAIKHVSQRCLFTKQYVACGKIGHFLCSVITQGKCSKCCCRINNVYTTGATPSASTTTPAYRRRFHLWWWLHQYTSNTFHRLQDPDLNAVLLTIQDKTRQYNTIRTSD